jgi:hypothetical protein
LAETHYRRFKISKSIERFAREYARRPFFLFCGKIDSLARIDLYAAWEKFDRFCL